ncbi:MAG: VCBS repeat-containing protein [Puniceicoccales bacterium]|nr:VCBS repeat-containing protein [Puniceicoccales bacterium]
MKIISALSVSILGATVALASDDAQAPRLGAPLVTKLAWGTRSLSVADIDGDGLTDAALLNNDTGHIELLFQRKPGDPVEPQRTMRPDRWTPALDDALFRRESITGEPSMSALAIGDLNDDGLPDIAFTSARSGLTLIFQGPGKGVWHEPLRDKRYLPSPYQRTLKIAHLDGLDQAPSLVQLAKEGIVIWRFEKGTKGVVPKHFPTPSHYPTDTSDVMNLVVQDILGNGRFAIGTVTPGDEAILRLRLPATSGKGYGPETTQRLPSASFIDFETPLSLRPMPTFAATAPRQRLISAVRFAHNEQALDGASSAALLTYSLPDDATSPNQIAYFDMDGDGTKDLIVADAKGAKLLVSSGIADGSFGEFIEYPSLAGISAVAPVAVEGRPPVLLVLSEKEAMLGAIAFEKGSPIGFPASVPGIHKPLLLASQGTFAIVLARGTDDTTSLIRLSPKIDEKGTITWATQTLVKIETSRRDITGLQIADINNDQRPDLIAFVDREAMRFWTQATDGSFVDAAKDSAFRKGLLDGVTEADVSWEQIDDAGTHALLVASTGYVRALRLDEKGELSVLFQANSLRQGDRLRSPRMTTSAMGTSVLLAYNETAHALEWLERDAGGVFRAKQQIKLEPFAPLFSWKQEVAGEKTPRLLYLTRKRLLQLQTARRGLEASLTKIYESNIKGFSPKVVLVGDFAQGATGKGQAANSVILLDLASHLLELITPNDKNGAWNSALHFTLFDENPHYRGQRSAEAQPRGGCIADLTNDGRNDLVLLMHDRVFVYPGH